MKCKDTIFFPNKSKILKNNYIFAFYKNKVYATNL